MFIRNLCSSFFLSVIEHHFKDLVERSWRSCSAMLSAQCVVGCSQMSTFRSSKKPNIGLCSLSNPVSTHESLLHHMTPFSQWCRSLLLLISHVFGVVSSCFSVNVFLLMLSLNLCAPFLFLRFLAVLVQTCSLPKQRPLPTVISI